MKLKLRPEKDIQVLSISELDSPQNVDVLRAGITKLLKNGKNKIVLELLQAKSVPAEVIRELGRMKLLANELSGDIVISGLDTETKRQVDSFSKPPFAVTFNTTEEALTYFKPAPPPETPVAKVAAAAPTAPASGAPQAGAAAPNPDAAKQFKEEIRAREMGDVGSLKKQIERLTKENQSLTSLLAQKIWDRRVPPDAAGYQARIKELEAQLAGILEQPPAKA